MADTFVRLLLVWLFSTVITGMAKKNVLITGGAGFIGFHVGMKLAENSDNHIIAVDNFDKSYDVDLKQARADVLKKKGVAVYYGDTCDQQLMDHLFEKHHFDYVVHLVSAEDGSDKAKLVKSNTECLLVLLKTLMSYQSAHLVFASSYNVLDDDNNGLTPAFSLYTALKTGSERLVKAYCYEYGITAVGIRPFSVYGPWARPNGDIYRMALEMDTSNKVKVFSSEKSKVHVASRDYTYVGDVVDGILLAMNHVPEQCGEIYNIGSGREPVSMETVYSTLKEKLHKDASMKFMSLPMYEPLKTQADISEAKSVLGYSPNMDFEQGIEIFVEWFKEYHHQKKWSSPKPDHSLVDALAKDKVMYINKKYKKRIVSIRKEYEKKAEKINLPLTKYYPKEFKRFQGVDPNARIRGYIKDAKGDIKPTRVSELADWCKLIDECVAFDSKGRLYSHIPLKEKWSKKSGNDLYVAELDICKAGLNPCYGNCTCKYAGPSQAEYDCAEGFGMLHKNDQQDYCHELYVPGKTTSKEREFKILDRVEGRDWNEFIKNKPFVKIEKRYSDFGVVAYYPEAAGDIEKLKDACNKTYHCMGFVTNGELKGIIDHVHKWSESDHLHMYLRDVDYCSLHEEKCQCKHTAPAMFTCPEKKNTNSKRRKKTR